jgi:hypothetical protein
MRAIANWNEVLPWPRRLTETAVRVGGLLRPSVLRIKADLRNVPRYVLRWAVIFLALFGLLNLWESQGDGSVPTFVKSSRWLGAAPLRVSSRYCFAAGAGDEVRWAGLKPAMAILDAVNPEVAGWVRRNHDEGRLVFSDGHKEGRYTSEYLAKYDVLSNKLVVSGQIYAENDGTIAAVLCHEFRHSRQNLAKVARHLMSFMFHSGGDPAIIENDALLYEQEAYVAIFGSAREGKSL